MTFSKNYKPSQPRGLPASPPALLFVFFLAFALFSNALPALELEATTEELISAAPHVAHVKIISARQVPGYLKLVDYQVALIESFKGNPPPTFDIRVMHASRVLSQSGQKDVVGSEWFVVLGERNQNGFFPLRSLTSGRIRIVEDQGTGRKYLAHPVTGFGHTGRQMFDISRMRSEMHKRAIRSGRGGRP